MNLSFRTRSSDTFLGIPLWRKVIVFAALLGLSACETTGGVGRYNSKSQNGVRADNALIHAQLARGYLQQKQYAVAKEELEEALSIDPQHSDSHYVMALLMVELEQYPVAEKHFMSAVRFNRENSSAAHDFGVYLCQTRRERDAVKYFEIAASNPLFDKAELSYMRAGECLARVSDPQAESYLERALSVNPKLRPALFRLAELRHKRRDHFSARAYIERYMAITNPQPTALYLAYQIESSLNAHDVANKYRQTLLSDFSSSDQAKQLRQLKRLNRPNR